ncbi:DegT/DnrJ/EryC1/StrS family aminotransferase [Novosphingobium guangzhouense]|uniref:DegT/DnrJ/EryC1/StrS family aminotransferase n=1 Tax=Novosphingobium guangzhouense TaxID=1850347 RepID=UPI0011AEE712|nr:DegT/DnrJ/EryC1/StrS family aminotransferase [Novosphingobium guangzhouense]
MIPGLNRGLIPGALRHLLAYEPVLPTTDALAPYLRQIDRSRMYSNQGPLVKGLQHRLQTLLGIGEGTTVATNSGTGALVAAILAHAGSADPARPYAICPAHTFVATALAAAQCGYRPWLADVCEDSWTLDPDRLADHPMLHQVGLVVPVCAYGRPLDVARWARFQAATGIPVVIDAASAVEALVDGTMTCHPQIPIALSFHATKVLGCGEGGCVVLPDPALLARVTQTTNFGFMGSRDCQSVSFNGKMSEYHAAVALAELDGWAAKRADFARIARTYHSALQQAGVAMDALVLHPQIASNYVLYRCAGGAMAEHLRLALADAAVEARFWYGGGLHRHSYLIDAPCDDLPVSERLSATLLGLPMGAAMTAGDVARVVAVLVAVLVGAPASDHLAQPVWDRAAPIPASVPA